MRAVRFVSRIVDTSPHWAETPLFREVLPHLQLTPTGDAILLDWKPMPMRLGQRMLELEAPCAVCARRFHVVSTTPLVTRAFFNWAHDPPRVVRIGVSCSYERNEVCFRRSLRGVDRERATKAFRELKAEVDYCREHKAWNGQLSLFTR